ncbi:sensor histidine kinase [Streptomyces sp. NPDC093568]|uniref:sensor histidine kinase n=1 Tax=Streptomyces sp. NPDC093568 TaxID=3366041 RepID=UPI0037F45D4B
MPADRPAAGRRPHHSLLFRLVASSLLIVICAVAATAWLAVRSTTSAVRQQQGQVLRDDTSIYRAMVSYAATHPDWSDVDPVVRDLANRTGYRITLMPQDGTRRAVTTWPPGTTDPGTPFAVIDPLRVASTPSTPSTSAEEGGIHPEALGPYRLSAGERLRLAERADGVARCLESAGVAHTRSLGPNGRPRIAPVEEPGLQSRIDGTDGFRAKVADNCGVPELDRPTPGERDALTALNSLLGSCLTRQGLLAFRVGLDFQPTSASATARTSAGRACVESARREQLAPHVAPAMMLYVTGPGTTPDGFDLSRANVLRIIGVTATVLLLAIVVTVLNGTRLTGPLRALTRAVREGADTPVRPRGRDEIGRLTTAFNELTALRVRTEQQRRALVGDIAHELRTPLSTMRSTLEAGQDGVIPVDGRLTASLLEETLLLQHIIEDLQDLAAADAGTLRLRPESVDVRGVLDHVAAVHRTAAEGSGVTVTVTARDALDVSADPVRLRQILGNLVSNAVRHTTAGDTITLSARREGPLVTVDVADTGSGIAPEHLPYVFDRFWRADKSRNRSTGGSGLGLAIARKLTEAHGGTLTVTSAPAHGTVFTVRLP